MIHAARSIFDMRFGIVATDLFDVFLKLLAVLAEVMPKPGQSCPVRTVKVLNEAAIAEKSPPSV
jgi:hypothetical protein